MLRTTSPLFDLQKCCAVNQRYLPTVILWLYNFYFFYLNKTFEFIRHDYSEQT